MKKENKTIFVFHVDNAIDLITNSSSELFVLKGSSEEIVKEMITNVYEDYLDEYEEVVSLADLSTSNLSLYLDYAYHTWGGSDTQLADKFNLDPKDVYEGYENRHLQKYWYPRISKEGAELIKSKLNQNLYFLFSKDDNPNFDKQEDLMSIGDRYHLG